MRERRCFVQFIHPGGEHWTDTPQMKSWNRDLHRRKFLKSAGRYLADGDLHSGELEFWGEWEPESRVVKRYNERVEDGPHFLYEPYYVHNPDGRWKQNTDPFVFGDHFHYTGCLQHTSRGETQLRHLAPGSVVLFGSCRQKSRFVVDTVLVVSERHVDHTRSDFMETLRPAVSDVYWAATGEVWYTGDAPTDRSHRLYFGAMYDEPVNGTFSFFPCRPYDADGNGFARAEINIPGFITRHLTQGKKIARDLSPDELRELWEIVATQVREQGLFLGVHATLPPNEVAPTDTSFAAAPFQRLGGPPERGELMTH
jgi:hypothetical protein